MLAPSWYGWSAQAKLHWIMPIIGTGIFGFGESHFCFILDENTIYSYFRDDGDFVSKSIDGCTVEILTNTVLLFNVVVACPFNFTWLIHFRMPRVPLQLPLYVLTFEIEVCWLTATLIS